MDRKTGSPRSGKEDRDARLKAALKANLARRKQQAKARRPDRADATESSKKDNE